MKPSINLPCVVTDIVDGDTVTVDVRVPMRVRLLDCWAPESYREGGEEAAEHLERIAKGRPGVVSVPLADVSRLDQVFTFGRVLGDVWIDGDDESIAQQQVAVGLASRTKP